MSLYNDFFSDYMFEIDYPFGMPCDEWTTKDGRKIKITKMTTEHIKNCMKIVGEDDLWYSHFEKELKGRESK